MLKKHNTYIKIKCLLILIKGVISMEDKKNKCTDFQKEQIDEALERLGSEISRDYEGKKLYVLSLLRGSFIFAADLVRKIQVPTKIGFMTTSSYGHDEQSSGVVKVVNDVPDNIEGYDVLVIDDIVDSGITMEFVMNHMKELGC